MDDQSIDSWPFAPLRPILNDLFTQDDSTNGTMSRVRDIIIGPCSLYLAAKASANKFTYLRREFSESRLTNVRVYESLFDDRQTNTDADNRRRQLKMTIHVVDRGADKDKKISDLATAISKFDIVMISVSRTNVYRSEHDNDSEETNILDQGADSLIRVEFQILTEFFPSSLVGQSFDSGHYDYYESPFMQPIAIGCYFKESADIDSDSVREFKIPALQMSAEYFTTRGSKGISYVALDGHNHVLRIDRDGRKNLYDLKMRKSYHVAQYSAQDDPNGSLILENKPTCCVLDIKDASLHTNAAFERLIGLPQHDKAQYMGSRTIKSVLYEVYETEILYEGKERGYNLPILLEAAEFSMPPEQKEKRYFVTYYMHGSNARLIRRKRGPTATGDESSRVSFPYFIELWELNTWTNKRGLINRLEFLQFSWTLDVQPSNDPATQDLSYIFNVEECSKDVSSQADLSFFIRRNISTNHRESEIRALESNVPLIREVVHENLAKVFEISPLSIARVRVSVRESGEILVESRISELITCLISFDQIGDISINDRQMQKLHVYRNRHSIDECKLDSISERRDHWAAFCPKKAECLIINKTQELFRAIENRRRRSINAARNSTISEDGDDLCYVMIFGCTPYFNKDDDVYSKIKDSLHKLSRDDFVFELPAKDIETKDWRWLRYFGEGHSPQLHRLDSTGGTLRHIEAATSLKGLRYTTSEEEPSTINSNMNVDFATPEDTQEENGLFRKCYIACHLDSLCGSFSYCIRTKRLRNQYDCVLSSTRLTRETLDKIIGSTTIDLREGGKFKLTVTSDIESQAMMMKRDAACSLHPKDYLSEYKISKSYKPARSELPVADIVSTDKKHSMSGRHLSLNDCAGLSFDRNLWLNPVDSNFTYCSITSECFMSDDEGLKEAVSAQSDKHCYVFRRSHSMNYDRQMMKSMSLRVKTSSGQSSKSNGKLDRQYEESQDRMNLVQRFQGLSADECARDCNLRKTNCLAFDFCRAGTMTCMLYSIRSPAHNRNAAHAMTQIEERFRSLGGSVGLNDVPDCTHYYLKDDHLEIRLQQIKSHLYEQGMSTNVSDKVLDKRRKRLDDVETLIVDDDQRRNEDEMAADDSVENSASGSDSGDFDFSFAIMGLVFATLVTYKQEVLERTISAYIAIKNKLRHSTAQEPDQQMIVELDTYRLHDEAPGLINGS